MSWEEIQRPHPEMSGNAKYFGWKGNNYPCIIISIHRYSCGIKIEICSKSAKNCWIEASHLPTQLIPVLIDILKKEENNESL